jgi:hypothetical protein
MDTEDDAMGVPDLPTIDLTEVTTGATAGPVAVPLDRRTYEDRFAELGFGLGVVPRKQHRDDAWWETPAGMLAVIGFVLLVLWALASIG